MDATTLRIVLLVLGAVFLTGIYLYETNRRKRDSAQARRRRSNKVSAAEQSVPPEPQTEPVEKQDEAESIASSEGDDTWSNWDEEDTERLDQEIDEIGSVAVDDETPPELKLKADGESMPAEEPEQQDLFGFSAQEESPVDVPVLIIQINLRARSAPFSGPLIVKATKETGLVMSELSIYQRLSSDGKPQFNMASMVEPGVFPKQDVDAFTTPGVTLFTQLPAPGGDGMAIFSDMLFTAERLAATLDGELQDETHSVLSKQTIEHMRGQIIEHRRKVQLARRKG